MEINSKLHVLVDRTSLFRPRDRHCVTEEPFIPIRVLRLMNDDTYMKYLCESKGRESMYSII